jgi:hypothetical protein
MTLPAKATRAGTVLAFNATTGNPEAGPSIGSVTTVAAQSANINTVATNIASVNTVAGNNTNINTVAGISGNVTTVAGVSANVTTVAGISANVTTVAGNNANVSTVAGISGNVTTVAGISANVTTVAGINADVSTVATNNANVTTVATNIASVNTNATNIVAIQNASTNATNAATSATNAANSATAAAASAAAAAASFDAFDDIYLGAKASNPTVDNDGDPLSTGDQYFNTVSNELRVWNGSSWQAASVIGGTVNSLDVTGVASFSDGTVSLPSITNIGDTNTGIFFPAADTIAFTEGGVESMRIDSSGNVGIGTSSPAFISGGGLEIYNSSVSRLKLTNSTTGTASTDGLDIHISSVDANIIVRENFPLLIYTNNTERMRINSSGDVGIGTSSPSTKFQVNGAASTNNTSRFVAKFTDTSAVALGNGGGIMFQGVYTGTTALDCSGIQAYKENATDGNYSYAMTLATRANGGDLTERMRIDSSGNVGIGTSSPSSKLDVTSATGNTVLTVANTSGTIQLQQNVNDGYINMTGTGNIVFRNSVSYVERMRITSGGNLLVATTSSDVADANGTGASFSAAGNAQFSRASGGVMNVNRKTDDGTLVFFQQDASAEGSISVSGTTVSYNGGHLSRWSQLPNNQKDNTLLKGTVMSNLDDMCVWTKDGEVLPNEQLNKMKVSDIDGDTNVAGVFVSWEFDEQCQSDDMNVAMTGDMIIRIAESVVVQKGDLLMSAGDGTAKPQGDDIRKSKTIAKVTSNHVTCTYADGSYCVPCVLMAC